jgi:hypothetical protein
VCRRRNKKRFTSSPGRVFLQTDADLSLSLARSLARALSRSLALGMHRSVGIPAHFAFILDPSIHSRDMLPPESIKTGGSLARV